MKTNPEIVLYMAERIVERNEAENRTRGRMPR
jgi:hypothetical protein